MNTKDKQTLVIAGSGLVIVLAFWSSIIYIVSHFIMKWW